MAMVKWEPESSQKDANANSAFAKSLAFSSFSLPLLNSLPSPFLASALDADARPGQNSTSDRNVAVCQLCRMPMLSMPLLDVSGRLVESSFMLKVLHRLCTLRFRRRPLSSGAFNLPGSPWAAAARFTSS